MSSVFLASIGTPHTHDGDIWCDISPPLNLDCWIVGNVPKTEICTTSGRHPQGHLRDTADNLAIAVVVQHHLSLALHQAIVHSLSASALVSDASIVPS